MTSVIEADPDILRAVEQLGVPSTKERRGTSRKPFRVVQRIAQAVGRTVPEQAAFFPVKCHDLSTRGFSFVAKRRPQSKSIVLALGTPPDELYLAAEIKHCTEVLVHASGKVEVLEEQDSETGLEGRSEDGAELYLMVGCEFTGRLESEDSQQAVEE